MTKSSHIAIALSAALLLAACQQEAAAPAASTSATPTAPSAVDQQAAIAPATSPLFSITPASMTACDPAAVGTVKWDVRSAHPEASTISIWAGTGPGAKLFASGGASGQAQTGPWVRPGGQFQLKDQATGKDLGQITVGGPECP